MPVTTAVIFLLLTAAAGARLWVSFRIEAYLRSRHPLLADQFRAPPQLKIGSVQEERAQEEADQRLRAFIASGAAHELRDPQLDTLLQFRRIASWFAGICIVASVAAFTWPMIAPR